MLYLEAFMSSLLSVCVYVCVWFSSKVFSLGVATESALILLPNVLYSYLIENISIHAKWLKVNFPEKMAQSCVVITSYLFADDDKTMTL